MLLSLDDLNRLFDVPTLQNASALLELDRLIKPDVRRNGQQITSIIRPPSEAAIRIYIRIDRKGGCLTPIIKGECSSCGKGACHHIAAVLLKSLAENTKIDQLTETTKQRVNNPTPSQYPEHIQQRLLYLLFPVDREQDGIEVATFTAKLNKDSGKFTHLQHYEPSWASSGTPPRYLLKSDLELLRALDKTTLKPGQKRHKLYGSTGQQMLLQILNSDRSFIGQLEQRAKEGGSRKGQLQWQLDEMGNQQLILKVTPKASTTFLMPAAHYLDQSTGECGEIEATLSTPIIEELLHQSAMNPEEVMRYYQTVMARHIELPAPHTLEFEQLATCQPTPHLRLTTLAGDTPQEQIKLTFDYNDLQISRKQASQQLLLGERVIQVTRREDFESASVETLQGLGLSQVRDNSQDDLFTLNRGEESWLKLQHQQLPQLKENGWQISIDDHFRYRLAIVDEWFTALEPAESGNHYHFTFGAKIDDKPVNLLPALVQLLKGEGWSSIHRLSPHHCFYIKLEEGLRLALPLAKIRPIIDNLFELFQADALNGSGHLLLSKIQLARLNRDDTDQHHWFDHSEVRSLAERLRQMEHPTKVTPPAGLQATLRDYQLQGLSWLQFLRDNELAGILADDMGLGKTVQSLAHILVEKEQGRLHHPCLIIAPTSLVINWRQEAKRFTPDLKVLVLHGQTRQKRFADIPYNDLIITTYPLLLRDFETHCRQHYHLLILDEAQTIKNSHAKASQLVREIPARYRLCLTGTPMENHLGELWSLFDFLLPGLLGSEQQFQRVIRNPIEKSGDQATSQRLAGWLRPFMLRRTKQAVATELPEKTEIIRSVALEGEQQQLYERIRQDMQNKIKNAVAEKGVGQCRILVINALLRMRQVCCDPRLLGDENSRGVTLSGKLNLLMEMLPKMIEEGRRILLFSQFTGMLELIEAEVKKAEIPYAKLTGKTRNRAGQVDKFQNKEVPLFLISLKAGGVGLNLTSADSVIHYDPWWNPAVERQATDRAHRIGQSNPVFVYKLITAETVEEKIQAMQARKQQLADSLFEHSNGDQTWWNETDLDALFEPLN
jgi:superfamily II DNA or RNA helicase